MALAYDAFLNGSVGTTLRLPVPETATGIVIGGLTFQATLDGAYVADPVTDYSMALIEVDDVNAPGLYVLELTPDTEGTLFLRFISGGNDYQYTITVQPPVPADATLEGEYTLTVEAPTGTPQQGAVVRVFDAAGTAFVTRGVTDAAGEVTFTLPVGNYQIRAFKDGVDFSAINPTTITVTPTAEAAPIIYEVLPTEASIGDVIAIIGSLFDSTSQVTFGAEETIAADYVNVDGTVLLATVPTLTGTIFSIRVDKPDPADPPAGKLLSNSVTWTRV